jgi:hypothetical protein
MNDDQIRKLTNAIYGVESAINNVVKILWWIALWLFLSAFN